MFGRLLPVVLPVVLLSFVGNVSADLVTHYALDDTSGTVANDNSGNGNDGTVSDHGWGVAGANANTGTAVHVGANGDLTGYAPGVSGNFALILWINPSYSGYNRIVNFGDAGRVLHFSHEESNWELAWDSEEPFAGGGGLHGGWQHLAFVVTGGSNMQIYYDGSSFWNGSVGSTVPIHEFHITHSPQHPEPLEADIDDVAVFDEALNQAAINDYMSNGIIMGPTIRFGSATSGGLETLSQAQLTVVLKNPQPGQACAVDYAAAGGTATGDGVDYMLTGPCDCDFDAGGQVNFLDLAVFVDNWLSEAFDNIADITGDGNVDFKDFAACAAEWLAGCGGRLQFEPGQTSKTIAIDIMDDGLDEEDETIIVELVNPMGVDVRLGTPSQHTYTIIDPRPTVRFDTSTSSGMEGMASAVIPVSLSHAWSETVKVNYAVTGGTAAGGGVDYTLTAGTLEFEPGQTGSNITIYIVDDQSEEIPETVELSLSNPTNAKLADNSQHTFRIYDNDRLVVLEEFVGDSFSEFNHASTIAETHNGTLVVAWYGGSDEGNDDVSIWASRNDGSGWSGRVEVDDGSGDPTWNPVLFQPSNGPLLLYYKYSGSPSSWRGAVRKSFDDARTWSGRIQLPGCNCSYLSDYGGRFVGPSKNKPLELPDGTLLCGASTEHDGWQVHMELARGDYSSDFELIGPLGGGEAIQPTFMVHSDDYRTIQAICRQAGGDNPRTTWSYDMGRTWTSLTSLDINTSKGLDVVTINNLNSAKRRWHVLAHNPTGRTPLAVAVSQDGVNWNLAIPELDREDGADMDYPSIIQTSDRTLHIVFSWRGKSKVKHIVLNPYVLLSETPE